MGLTFPSRFADRTRRSSPALIVVVLLCLVLLGSGCVRNRPGTPPGMVGVAMPPELAPIATKLNAEGQKNWVLNLNELAVAAMRMGERDIARRALDESILEINAVFGSTPEAARARSIFFNEDVKLFKGDPYERSMTFLYRGVLYMQDGDYENARASFRSGILQDGFAEEEQNRADWAVLDYLISVCEIRLSRPFYADEALARARETYQAFPAKYEAFSGPPVNIEPDALAGIRLEDNLLVIGQTGAAPVKIRVGDYGQYLGYQRGNMPVGDTVVVARGGDRRAALTLDSVYYQASTRGGRAFDKIQGRKVVFKETSSAVGVGSTMLGLQVLSANNGDNMSGEQAVVGAALVGAGLVFTLFSELISTRADIRQWTSLPETLSVYTSSTRAGPGELTVTLPGNQVASMALNFPKPGEGLVVALVFPGETPTILATSTAIPPRATTTIADLQTTATTTHNTTTTSNLIQELQP